MPPTVWPTFTTRGTLTEEISETGLQQRAAQAAGQASVDGGQVTVGGAC